MLRWWQKKLPLKNQPSNPHRAACCAPGLDESSRYLTEARVELLDPERRRRVDEELAAQANEQAVKEFEKFLSFTVADGTLAEEEKNRCFGSERNMAMAEESASVKLIDAGDSTAQRSSALCRRPPVSSNDRSARRSERQNLCGCCA